MIVYKQFLQHEISATKLFRQLQAIATMHVSIVNFIMQPNCIKILKFKAMEFTQKLNPYSHVKSMQTYQYSCAYVTTIMNLISYWLFAAFTVQLQPIAMRRTPGANTCSYASDCNRRDFVVRSYNEKKMLDSYWRNCPTLYLIRRRDLIITKLEEKRHESPLNNSYTYLSNNLQNSTVIISILVAYRSMHCLFTLLP